MKQISVIAQQKSSCKIVNIFVESSKTLDDIVKEIRSQNRVQEILVDCDQDSILVRSEFSVNRKFSFFEISSILNMNPLLLFPIVAIDERGTVLMQAYGNQQSLDLSFSTGYAHYFSRSRNKMWKKGEESGHTQELKNVLYRDEDDSFVFVVKQNVAACHTGYYSCFFTKLSESGQEIVYSEKMFEPVKVYS